MKQSKFIKKINQIEEQTDTLYELTLKKLSLLSMTHSLVDELKQLGFNNKLDFKKMLQIEKTNVEIETNLVEEQIVQLTEMYNAYSEAKNKIEEELYSDNPEHISEDTLATSVNKDSGFKIYTIKDPIL